MDKYAIAALSQQIRDAGIDLAAERNPERVDELAVGLASIEFEAISAGAEVQVTMSCKGTLIDVLLRDDLLEEEGARTVAGHIVEAIRNAEETLRVCLLSLQGVRVG